MRIFYYQRRDRVPNFGDELNTWLWEKLLADVLAQPNDTVLVGLGTLLNDALPQRLGKAASVVLFSTGAGYERPLRSIPATWKLYCVRGPLSAQRLGLPPTAAVTDGGILLRRLVSPVPQQRGRVAVMPHVHHAHFAEAVWAQVCQELGYAYIDPRWPVEQVIGAIQQSELLVAEAMHGAIAADALGVPWLPLVTSPRILPFKWQDWCASIRQPYQPVYLPSLAAYPPYGQGLRSGLRATALWGRWWRQGATGRGKASPERMAIALAKMVQQGQPILSDRARLESLTVELEQRLEHLRQDCLLDLTQN